MIDKRSHVDDEVYQRRFCTLTGNGMPIPHALAHTSIKSHASSLSIVQRTNAMAAEGGSSHPLGCSATTRL